MINIFYNPGYIKTKKVFLTKSFKHSILYNLFLNLAYIFNFRIPDSLITSGPQKRMNNAVKAFKNDQSFSLNNIKGSNSYLLQFDDFGERTINKLIESYGNKNKILVGPLYSLSGVKKLEKYVNKYPYIKIVVASPVGKENLLNEIKLNVPEEKIVIFPSGIVGQEELLQKTAFSKEEKEIDCLIYFKKRSKDELSLAKKLCENYGLNFKVFKYGSFNNRKLITTAYKAKFILLVTGTESQGFANQELMATNTPILVWDHTVNVYENFKLTGTSVPYFSKESGIIVNSYSELEKRLESFINNLDLYKPKKLILKDLTYEKYKQNLMEQFLNF